MKRLNNNSNNKTQAPTNSKNALINLTALSVTHKIKQMRQASQGLIYLMGRIAASGQITAFFGAPNTGKTLLSLHLLAEAIAALPINKSVFHINLDDSFEGTLEKAELAQRHGFLSLDSETFKKPCEDFEKWIEDLVLEDSAKDVVLVIDTFKKFSDPMNKKDSSKFMNICRRFSRAGGTVIILAHTNKNKDSEGLSIPAGTNDVLEDCDCAYVLELLNEEPIATGIKRTVEFRNIKRRGNVVDKSAYSYTLNDTESYKDLFDSIVQVNPARADEIRTKEALKKDQDRDSDLIQKIVSLLLMHNSLNQSEIINMLNADASKVSIRQCLLRWDCPESKGGRWSSIKGANNSYNYKLK